MSNRTICKIVVFNVWCMIVSIGIEFFQSDVWNTIKHMTPEETFALYPEYFVYFVISVLLFIGLVMITKHIYREEESEEI